MESKEKILIVDDDVSICKTLEFIFNKKGYHVETVGTGREALEIAQKESFNLALLDIKLPDVAGIELLVLLKKLHSNMKAIMMTAYTSFETVVRALNEGASGYITKPLNLDEILNKIDKIFETQHLIRDKKKLEQNLQYQAMLVANVSDAIISTDINLKIKSWNNAAEKMYGWKSNEIIGKPMSEIIPEEAHHDQPGEVREHIFDKGFWKGEISQKTKDNSTLSIYSSASLIKDNLGKIQGVVIINKDITERKRSEAEIVDLAKFPSQNPNPVLRVTKGKVIYTNKQGEKIFNILEGSEVPAELQEILFKALEVNETISTEITLNEHVFSFDITPISAEGYVNVYGRDITDHKKAEVELRKIMKDLKTSNTELEQFAYVASHDLQEPLRMVASFTQLLRDRYKDKLDEDANDFINYAVDGATRMQNLINDLLIFSRVGSRGKPFKTIDMNVVLESVLNNLRPLIGDSNTIITSDPLPVIEADESQMIQLFQNLISNGIKFRGENHPKIHVTAEIKATKWIFTVSDNGIGIDSAFFDRIFIIFQRLHKKSEYGGTGIGLAVCKKIVQRHGGKIWVDSEFGKGSSFRFTIKRKKGK